MKLSYLLAQKKRLFNWLFCLILPLLAMSYGQAIQLNTKYEISTQIDMLFNDNSISIDQQLTEIERLITLAKENRWQEQLIKSHAVLVGLFIYLERLDEIPPIVDKYLPLAKQYSMTDVVIRFKITLLYFHDFKNNQKHYNSLRQELLTMAYSIKNDNQKADIYHAVGESYYASKEIFEAQKYLVRSYKLYKKIANKEGLAISINALANIYSELGQHNLAIQYYQESLLIQKSLGDLISQSIIWHNLGVSYVDLKEHSKAESAFKTALQLIAGQNDPIGIAYITLAQAGLEFKKHNYPVALNLYTQAFKLFESLQETKKSFDARIGKTKTLIALKEGRKALQTLNELSKLDQLLSLANYKLEYLKYNAQALALTGQYDQAYRIQKQYSTFKTQEYERDRKYNIEESMIRNDTERKEIENLKLQKENALQAIIINQQSSEKQRWLVITRASIVFVFLCFTIAYLQMKHRLRFKKLALRDPLTNAPNRRSILKHADKLYHSIHNSVNKESQKTMTIGLVDLDHFKLINDTFGHDVGDEILKAFAQSCFTTLRKNDYFGRYGGEEWLFLFTDTNSAEVIKIFKRLQKSLNNIQNRQMVNNKPISFSIGISQYLPKRNEKLSQLIAQADDALYKAKNAGRNRLSLNSDICLLS